MLIGIRVGELLQACAVGVDPVEVGGAALTLATEEQPVAVGRELWMILAVHLPGCDLARILWRARRVEALDEHRRRVVLQASAFEDQHLPIRRERWPKVFELQRSPLSDVANLVGIAPVEPDDEDPLDYGTLITLITLITRILRADDAPELLRCLLLRCLPWGTSTRLRWRTRIRIHERGSTVRTEQIIFRL